MAVAYAITVNPEAGGRCVIDKQMGSVAQYLFLRKGGFIFGATPEQSKPDGVYYPGHQHSFDALRKAFAVKFATGDHTITITTSTDI